jgi:hypothetical protein
MPGYLALRHCREINPFRRTFLPYLTNMAVFDGESETHWRRGAAMSGINTPHIMLGQAGSMTGFHGEDLNFFSVNYLHSGASKRWGCKLYLHSFTRRENFHSLVF